LAQVAKAADEPFKSDIGLLQIARWADGILVLAPFLQVSAVKRQEPVCVELVEHADNECRFPLASGTHGYALPSVIAHAT
jgi:hypothetical protein